MAGWPAPPLAFIRITLYSAKKTAKEPFMKRTQVMLDETLMQDCIKATGIKTQRALIDHALRELLRREKQMEILQLKGGIEWQGSLEEWRQRRDA
jgi:Arc/MetJ family transcription regulator